MHCKNFSANYACCIYLFWVNYGYTLITAIEIITIKFKSLVGEGELLHTSSQFLCLKGAESFDRYNCTESYICSQNIYMKQLYFIKYYLSKN